MDEILERRRRLVVNLLHAAGAVTVVALWAFESDAGLITKLDRYGYPILLLTLGLGLAMRRLRPRLRVLAELGASAVFAGYFVASILSFLILQSDSRVYTVANTLQWMPMLYLAAFFFPRRIAVAASWSVFALALLVPVAALFWDKFAAWDSALLSLLVNAYVVHLLTLACLSLLALFGSQYERAQLHARALERAILTHPLTGIANRRGLERALEHLNRTPGRLLG